MRFMWSSVLEVGMLANAWLSVVTRYR